MNKKTKKDAGPGKAIAIASAVAVVIVVVILLLLRSCGAPVDDHGGIELTRLPPRAAGMRPTPTRSSPVSTRRSRKA